MIGLDHVHQCSCFSSQMPFVNSEPHHIYILSSDPSRINERKYRYSRSYLLQSHAITLYLTKSESFSIWINVLLIQFHRC